jgi:hypothetical protein
MSIERELLRKVFESGMLDRALTSEVGQLISQPEQEQEVYQYRHKLPEAAFWSQWVECEIDYYKTYLNTPIKANLYGTLIEYQVRALYAAPSKPAHIASNYEDMLNDVLYVVNAFYNNCDADLYSNEIHQACADLQKLRHDLRPLSDAKLKAIVIEDEYLLFCSEEEFIDIARAIERAHGIGERQ